MTTLLSVRVLSQCITLDIKFFAFTGTSLVSLGRAHCQVATLQEAFSVLFHETYLASIQRAEDDIKEYQAQRKKLDSRR